MRGSSPYRLALRAYPPAYRHQHGGELVDTARALAGGRWSFRQWRSLLIGGLRTRALLASHGSAREVWTSALALALALGYLIPTAGMIAYLLGATGGISYETPSSLWIVVGMGLIPLAVLTVTTRWPAFLAVIGCPVVGMTLAMWVDTSGWSLSLYLQSLAWMVIGGGALAGVVASRGGGGRALSPTTAAILLAGAVAASYLLDSPHPEAVSAVVYLGLPLVGLVLVAVDPRPLIVATALWLRSAGGLVLGTLQIGDPLLVPGAMMVGVAVAALLSLWGTRRLVARIPT